MSEDTIISSSPKPNKSIHTTRLKRKNKRHTVETSVQQNWDQPQSSACFYDILKELYEDSEEELKEIGTGIKNFNDLIKSPAVIRNFQPFNYEKSLAMADHLFVQQPGQNKPTCFPETQGFVACTDLNDANNEAECAESNKGTSFLITESELLSCCHQVEQELQNCIVKEEDNIKHELTPKKKDGIILINSILADFSQSPLSDEKIVKNVSWEYTPEFRMRRKPIKSYIRKDLKSTRTNLNQRFEDLEAKDSSENGEDYSFCSSLSVQEDDTLCKNISNQSASTNLNNTQHLCENLLNLTEYFTQNDFKESLSDEQQLLYKDDLTINNIPNLNEMSKLFKDIITLRSIYPMSTPSDSYNSCDDFLGFGNNEYEVHPQDDEGTVNFTKGFRVRNIGNLDIVTNKENNSCLAGWNEDVSDDIFDYINTDSCLHQNDIQISVNERMETTEDDPSPNSACNDENFSVPKVQFQHQDIVNSVGFKTAASKPIKVSRGAHIMAAKILSQLPDIPDFAENTLLRSCDNKPLHKGAGNRDDGHDILDGINGKLSNKGSINSKTDDLKPRTADVKENFTVPELRIQNDSLGKCVGFKTAASKPIKVSREAHIMAAKILSQLPDIDGNPTLHSCDNKTLDKEENIFDNPEDYDEWNDDCDLFLDFQTPLPFREKSEINTKRPDPLTVPNPKMEIPDTSSLPQLEFKTAAGNNMCITSKGQAVAKKLLNDFFGDIKDNNNYEESLKEMKCKIYAKTHNLRTEPLSPSSCKLISADGTFQTLKGRDISITSQHNLQNDLEKNKAEDIKSLKLKFTNIDIGQSMAILKEISQLKQDASSSNLLMLSSKELKAKSGKNIEVPAEAQNTLQNLLELSETPKEINESNNQQKNADIAAENRLLEKQSLNIDNSNTANINMGFQTANGKKVIISAKAKQAADSILKDINTVVDIEICENDLKEMKTKIISKNKDLKRTSDPNISEYVNTDLNSPSYLKLSNNFIPKLETIKRKISIDNSDLESTIKTPVKIFKNDLHPAKSLLAEQSLKSPLASASHSIILRKNLLSLTKKRKNKANTLTLPAKESPKLTKEIYDLNANAATPTKSCISFKGGEPAPATPNLNEFLSNAPLTSTPRINKPSNYSQTLEDSDLKPIIWKNNNDSFSNNSTSNSLETSKLLDSSPSKISLSSSKPTAKERISRLEMYGKAPSVSPILIETNQKCRPSGLRRTRSMFKKSE